MTKDFEIQLDFGKNKGQMITSYRYTKEFIREKSISF